MTSPATRRATAKERVLKKYPKAYAAYYGLSLRFVITNDHRGAHISGIRSRVSDAWADAARRLK